VVVVLVVSRASLPTIFIKLKLNQGANQIELDLASSRGSNKGSRGQKGVSPI
jgi:hypothetical protein